MQHPSEDEPEGSAELEDEGQKVEAFENPCRRMQEGWSHEQEEGGERDDPGWQRCQQKQPWPLPGWNTP